MSYGFSLFPLFSQNIPNKMISKKKKKLTLKNLKVTTCYSNEIKKEFRSNIIYFRNNLFRANFKKLFEYNKMCYYFLL